MTNKHSYKEIEKQRRENDILAAAEQMLSQGGYANLNMDELANHIGLSKPTLYQHFKSKEDLAVRVLLRSYKSIDEFLSRPLDGPAMDRLLELLRRFLMMRAPGSLFAMLRSDLGHDMIRNAARGLSDFEDRKRQFFGQINTLVDAAKAEGAIDPVLPTPIVTHTVIALGQSLARTAMHAELVSDPAQMEATVQSVLRIFICGVAPQVEPIPDPKP